MRIPRTVGIPALWTMHDLCELTVGGWYGPKMGACGNMTGEVGPKREGMGVADKRRKAYRACVLSEFQEPGGSRRLEDSSSVAS